jgi:hypothetical protein
VRKIKPLCAESFILLNERMWVCEKVPSTVIFYFYFLIFLTAADFNGNHQSDQVAPTKMSDSVSVLYSAQDGRGRYCVANRDIRKEGGRCRKRLGLHHWQCRASGDSDILCTKRKQSGKDSVIEEQPFLLFM